MRDLLEINDFLSIGSSKSKLVIVDSLDLILSPSVVDSS